MENPQQLLIETQFEGLTLYVRPHETHEWLMETKLVAEGYRVSESSIREHKRKNHDELIEGKHYLCVRNSDAQIMNIKLDSMVREQTFWTKRGVIHLGFFIKSEMARLFRNWAEDLIIRELEKKERYITLEMLKENNKQQDAKMHQYLDALYKILKKDIHNLTSRVDNLEQYIYKPKLLPEEKAYTYLMRKRNTNEYKIGKSTNPIKRAKVFKNAGTDIEIIITIELINDTLAQMWEKTLQVTFEHLKIGGEWFVLQPCDVEVIKKISEAFEGFYDRK